MSIIMMLISPCRSPSESRRGAPGIITPTTPCIPAETRHVQSTLLRIPLYIPLIPFVILLASIPQSFFHLSCYAAVVILRDGDGSSRVLFIRRTTYILLRSRSAFAYCARYHRYITQAIHAFYMFCLRVCNIYGALGTGDSTGICPCSYFGQGYRRSPDKVYTSLTLSMFCSGVSNKSVCMNRTDIPSTPERSR